MSATSTLVNLDSAADELLDEARSASAGRSARTITGRAGSPFKQTLMALTDGASLNDHDGPELATLQVVSGEVRLTSAEGDVDLSIGDHIHIPAAQHGLTALSDTVVLLSVAR